MTVPLRLALVSLALAAAPSAWAQSYELHEVRAEGLSAEARSQLQRLLREALTEVAGSREVVAGGGGECRGAECHCRLARQRNSTFAVVGEISKLDGVFTFDLTLLEVARCAAASAVVVSEAVDEAQLPGLLRALLGRLLRDAEVPAKAAAAPVRPAAGAPTSAPAASEARPAPAAALQRAPSSNSGLLFWSLAGASAAGAVAGVGFGLAANSAHAQFELSRDLEAKSAARERARRFALVSDVGSGVAVAGAVGALLTWVLAAPEKSGAVAVSVGPGGAAVTLRWGP